LGNHHFSHFVSFIEILWKPADESAGSADESVLKHAQKPRFSGLSLAEPDASASGFASSVRIVYEYSLCQVSHRVGCANVEDMREEFCEKISNNFDLLARLTFTL
jgi:hypothetical protein